MSFWSFGFAQSDLPSCIRVILSPRHPVPVQSMEAASARMAARDRFGSWAEPATTPLQRYISMFSSGGCAEGSDLRVMEI